MNLQGFYVTSSGYKTRGPLHEVFIIMSLECMLGVHYFISTYLLFPFQEAEIQAEILMNGPVQGICGVFSIIVLIFNNYSQVSLLPPSASMTFIVCSDSAHQR